MAKVKNNLLQRANVYANLFRVGLWTVIVAIPSIGGLELLDAHESNAAKIKHNILVIDNMQREIISLEAQVSIQSSIIDILKRQSK